MRSVAKLVDEQLQTAILALLSRFWIIREQDPELYQIIQNRGLELKEYFSQKLGCPLHIHYHYARVLKIPVKSSAFQGIKGIRRRLDYILFCCLLSFLEGREQFLLQDLCEELTCLIPKAQIDWKKYHYRLSLTHVLRTARECNLICEIEGDIDSFKDNESLEILFDVTPLVPYFMRNFSRHLSQYSNAREFIEDQSSVHHPDPLTQSRHRIYRQLLFSPAVYQDEMQKEDVIFLKKNQEQIAAELEQYLNVQLEVYKNISMLTIRDEEHEFELFPRKSFLHLLTLLFGREIRRKRGELGLRIEKDGSIQLTYSDIKDCISDLKNRYEENWPSTFKQKPVTILVKDLLDTLEQWKMAEWDGTYDVVKLKPLLGRLIGKYEKEDV